MDLPANSFLRVFRILRKFSIIDRDRTLQVTVEPMRRFTSRQLK